MGFRFRKSVSAGPFRINFSKSGIGYSVGTKGYRVTKKAGGGYRSTVSIPGTGISFVDESSTSSNKKRNHSSRSNGIANGPSFDGNSSQRGNNMKNKKTELILCLLLGWAGGHKFYRKKIGIGILYLLTLGLFCIGWWGDLLFLSMKYFSKSPLTKLHKITSYVLAFTLLFAFSTCGNNPETDLAPISTEDTSYSSLEDATEAPTIDTAPLSTEALETEAPTEKPTDPPPTEAPTEAAPQENTYILNTKSKVFHYPGCRGVKDMKESNKQEFIGTREEVLAKKYKSCGICHP